MLHPVATGWSMLGEGEEQAEQVNAYSERLNSFVQAFLATHYDFDFGDEQILAADASVMGREIVVGKAAYPLVVIPPEMRTLLPIHRQPAGAFPGSRRAGAGLQPAA